MSSLTLIKTKTIQDITPSGRCCPMGRLNFLTCRKLSDSPTLRHPNPPPIFFSFPTPHYHWIHHHWSHQNSQSTTISEVVHRVHHPIEGVQWPGQVTEIAKEEQGEWTEKDLLKFKKNIPPYSHSNKKCCGAAWCLLWRRIIVRWGWRGRCCWGGSIGGRSVLMGAGPFPLFYCPARKKWWMTIASGDARESWAKEVESKWLKGGSLA